MSQRVLDALTARFGEKVIATETRVGDDRAYVKAEALVEVVRFLRDDPGFAMKQLVELTAVDYLDLPDMAPQGQRFGLHYILHSFVTGERVELIVAASEDAPTVPSLFHEFKIANWYEREVWDMYGVTFEGHPDLRRILMYEEFEGFPLRKDYPVDGRQPRVGPVN